MIALANPNLIENRKIASGHLQQIFAGEGSKPGPWPNATERDATGVLWLNWMVRQGRIGQGDDVRAVRP